MRVSLLILIFLSSAVQAQTSFWRKTNGPYTGNILAVASDSGNYILGADANGVYRSSDGGTSWTQVQVPTTPSFGIRGDLVFAGGGVAMYRSTNGGVNWQQVYLINSPFEDYFTSYCITPGGTVLAGLNCCGMLRSTDAGKDWQSPALYPSDLFVRLIAADDRHRVFAVSDIHVLLSLDDGEHWTQQCTVPVSPSFNSLTFGPQGMLFAGSDSGGVYKSIDSGHTWTQTNIKLGSTHVRTVHCTRSGILFAGTTGSGLYSSTDNGGTWIRSSNGIVSRTINSVTSNMMGDILAGAIEGIYKSTNNGNSWTMLSPVRGAYTESIAFDQADNVYAGTSFGLYRSTDQGSTWLKMSGVSNFVKCVAFGSDGFGLLADDAGLYRTSDGGQTWTAINTFGSFNYSVLIQGNGCALAGTSTGLFRSSDTGITWTRVGDSLTATYVFVLASSQEWMFAGSMNGCMFRSSDQGFTWAQIQTDSSNGSVFGLAVHPDGHVFASTEYGGILRSADNGDDWAFTAFRDTLAYLAINSQGVILAATIYGVFESSDEGANWTPTNSGLDNLSVRSIGIDSHGYAVIGTNAGVVYISREPTTSVGQLIGPLVQKYTLDQNYPNPFNPTTTIRYAFPERTHVTLSIYNTLGQLVSTLVNGEEEPGYHEVKFDGSNLASGVYFYRLSAGSFIQTRKLLLIR